MLADSFIGFGEVATDVQDDESIVRFSLKREDLGIDVICGATPLRSNVLASVRRGDHVIVIGHLGESPDGGSCVYADTIGHDLRFCEVDARNW